MPLTFATIATVLSGGGVGFVLGLVGGGGSVLAVPLLLYVVGVPDPHVAIGTSALAVAVNAFANLGGHAHAGTVKWPCAATFAASGVAGALAGAALGQAVDGQRLLLAFGIVMLAIAGAMLRPSAAAGDPGVRLTGRIALKLVAAGLVTGLLAGFFGIGGGFLIVPALMFGSGMPLINAVGSSLLSVGTFGLATSASYAAAGLVDFGLAARFVAGGIVGGWVGIALARHLAGKRRLLSQLFAGLLGLVAAYVIWRSVSG